MTSQQESHKFARLTNVTDAVQFKMLLGEEQSRLHLQIQTWKEGVIEEGQTAANIVEAFETRQEDLPRDILLRAWNEDVEYAWFGIEGVVVRVETERTDPELTVVNIKLPTRTVQEIRRDGRVIYRKLCAPLKVSTAPIDSPMTSPEETMEAPT
jgi:hypothetical protein